MHPLMIYMPGMEPRVVRAIGDDGHVLYLGKRSRVLSFTGDA